MTPLFSLESNPDYFLDRIFLLRPYGDCLPYLPEDPDIYPAGKGRQLCVAGDDAIAANIKQVLQREKYVSFDTGKRLLSELTFKNICDLQEYATKTPQSSEALQTCVDLYWIYREPKVVVFHQSLTEIECQQITDMCPTASFFRSSDGGCWIVGSFELMTTRTRELLIGTTNELKHRKRSASSHHESGKQTPRSLTRPSRQLREFGPSFQLFQSIQGTTADNLVNFLKRDISLEPAANNASDPRPNFPISNERCGPRFWLDTEEGFVEVFPTEDGCILTSPDLSVCRASS